MQRFHVIKPDGEMLSGAKAFFYVWSLLPVWRHLARLPGVLSVTEACYRMFLVVRPTMQRIYRRWHQYRRRQTHF
jgi:predicted DCC family thiol-disulfide oxidoreductase YuxK